MRHIRADGMKTILMATTIIVVSAVPYIAPVNAETIERACLRSDRPQANRTVCGCIQDAANLTLSTKDQQRAAAFFKDPHKAQEIRQSDRRGDEAFWKRYRNFGQTAEAFCTT